MNRNIAGCRAGVLRRNDRMLTPDTRKGRLRVIVDEEELVHFQWLERDVDEPEIDIVIMPGEAVFEKISQGNGRSFHLKFSQEPDRSLFFWSQEPNVADDEVAANDINTALNSIIDGVEGTIPKTNIDIEPESFQDQGEASAPIAKHLAAALENIMAKSGMARNAEYIPDDVRRKLMGPSLVDILKTDRIVNLIDSYPSLADETMEHLPSEFQSKDSIKELVTTPQFRSQLSILSSAISSGQINTATFGLTSEPRFGVLDFLNAIQQDGQKEDSEKK